MIGSTENPGESQQRGDVVEIRSARQVRRMLCRDLPQVLDIEYRSFDYPWDEQQFIDSLRQRNCIGMVCEDLSSEKVLGYVIYELHKTRIHLLNLVVGFDHRREGIGSLIVVKLKNKLWLAPHRTTIILEVGETNLDAHLFYRSQDFQAVSVLRDFYIQNGEDAYLMQYKLKQEKENEDDVAVENV